MSDNKIKLQNNVFFVKLASGATLKVNQPIPTLKVSAPDSVLKITAPFLPLPAPGFELKGYRLFDTAGTHLLSVNSEQYIECDASLGDQLIKLPDAVQMVGRGFAIKRIDSTTNTVTIATQIAGQELDDVSSFTLETQMEAVFIASNGTEWRII